MKRWIRDRPWEVERGRDVWRLCCQPGGYKAGHQTWVFIVGEQQLLMIRTDIFCLLCWATAAVAFRLQDYAAEVEPEYQDYPAWDVVELQPEDLQQLSLAAPPPQTGLSRDYQPDNQDYYILNPEDYQTLEVSSEPIKVLSVVEIFKKLFCALTQTF